MSLPVRPRVLAEDASERLPVHPSVEVVVDPYGRVQDVEPLLEAIYRAKPVEREGALGMLGRYVETFLATGRAEDTALVLGVQVHLTRVRSRA
jgi:hypothetical protein